MAPAEVVTLCGAAGASEAPAGAAGLYRESPIAQLLHWQWTLKSVFLFLCFVPLVSPSGAAGASEAPAGAAGLYRESPIAQLLPRQWALKSVLLFLYIVILVSAQMLAASPKLV